VTTSKSITIAIKPARMTGGQRTQELREAMLRSAGDLHQLCADDELIMEAFGAIKSAMDSLCDVQRSMGTARGAIRKLSGFPEHDDDGHPALHELEMASFHQGDTGEALVEALILMLYGCGRGWKLPPDTGPTKPPQAAPKRKKGGAK